MNTVSDICSRLGRKNIEARLGVTKSAIANAASQGRFPARWYLVISEMCREEGVECPEDIFNFAPDETASDVERGAA